VTGTDNYIVFERFWEAGESFGNLQLNAKIKVLTTDGTNPADTIRYIGIYEYL